MFPYPLEDFLQVGQHGLFRGMIKGDGSDDPISRGNGITQNRILC